MRKVFRDGVEWTPAVCANFVNVVRGIVGKDPIPDAGRQKAVHANREPKYAGVHVYGRAGGRKTCYSPSVAELL